MYASQRRNMEIDQTSGSTHLSYTPTMPEHPPRSHETLLSTLLFGWDKSMEMISWPQLYTFLSHFKIQFASFFINRFPAFHSTPPKTHTHTHTHTETEREEKMRSLLPLFALIIGKTAVASPVTGTNSLNVTAVNNTTDADKTPEEKAKEWNHMFTAHRLRVIKKCLAEHLCVGRNGDGTNGECAFSCI